MEGSPEKVVEPKVEDAESNKSAPVEDLPNPSQNENVVPDDAEITESEGLPDDKVTPDTSIIPEKQPDEKIDDDSNAQPMEFTTPVVKSEAGTNGFNDMEMVDAYDSGTEDECAAFMKELEKFHKDNALDYKPPKFYGEPLNCLKLWRSVIRLGGYDRVTGSKLWRQVGESFHPPKTCTTVSWTFRIFYEKALLEYEKHKRQTGELQFSESALSEQAGAINESSGYKTPGPGRQRRDAAARAMQGWHSQRHHGYDEEKNSHSSTKREKHLKGIGVSKQKKPTVMENAEKALMIEGDKQIAISVIDLGSPADWVKINVRETKDCFEVYALVPGLLREEVRVQSDPAGRLVITGQPEQLDNPWGITPFKKVVNLPARIDPLQTSAVVSLHGRLFVRVPFEQSNYAR